MDKQIELYRSPDGKIEVHVQMNADTVWLSQKEMAELYDKDSDTISLHLKNIYEEEELIEHSTTEYFSVVQNEGKREVKRKIKFYNLDAIISVGYRVNSKRGTQFRQWATQRLKDFLVEGVAINEKRLAQKSKEVQILHDGIRILSRAIEDVASKSDDFTWLQQFSIGLQLLDDYDHEALDIVGKHNQETQYPVMEEYNLLVSTMQSEFNSNIFGKEKDGGFISAIHQIQQGFGSKDIYPSIEEKAAMLLYFL